MTITQLKKSLNTVNALRINRMRVATIVLDKPTLINPLIQIVFHVEEKVSVKAVWVLEFVVKSDFKLIIPYIELISQQSDKLHFDGAIRSMAKIIQIIVKEKTLEPFLTANIKSHFIEIVFDWLITNQKVAVKAYSMAILFKLGAQQQWVHQELKTYILQHMEEGSPAFKARGRITLNEISKFHKKTDEITHRFLLYFVIKLFFTHFICH